MQNHLIFGLNDLIKKYRFQEKILIVPSLYTGQQILQHLTMESPGWINIGPATVQTLAEDISRADIIKKDLKLISQIESNIIIDSIFSDLAREGELSYFKKNIINTGIIEAITGMITELKMSGITPEDLEPEHFIDPDKGQDLKLIYRQYEDILIQKGLADYPRTINMALDILKSGKTEKNHTKYIVFSRYANTYLERKFINAISGNDPAIIEGEKIHGIPEPENRWKNVERDRQPSCFCWLFDIESMPAGCVEMEIELFAAASYQNEVNEVLGRIIKEKIPLDTVELIYTGSDPYLSVIYNSLQKLGIAAAFPEGLPGDLSGPGKALKGIILWLMDDFDGIHLRRLLKQNLIKTPENRGSRLAHILRTSKIGWGRDRYMPVLEASIDKLRKKDDDRYMQKLEDLLALEKLSAELLDIFAGIGPGDIIFSRLSSACGEFLEKFIKAAGREDAGYISALRERLESLSRISEGMMPLEEAARRVMDIISKVPYRKASPEPGKILVSGIASGGVSGRKNTYIIGFDSRRFPGGAAQDPILLDEERKSMGRELILSEERLREKLYDLNLMMAGLRGNVTISYSAYDIKDDRSLFPSSVYLQAYRLKKIDSSIDYEHMLKGIGRPEGFSSPHITDQSGWWINRLTGGSTLRDGTDAVFDIYPCLRQGSIAMAARQESLLTEYDGYIGSQPGLDPRDNKDMVLSCTALESYAHCPWQFFLQYILGAYRPEEVTKDPFRWLDAARRGSLLHEVFQNYAAVKAKGDKEDIYLILDRTLKKYRLEVPVPGRAVYENEAARLKKDLDVFLELDSQLAETLHAEYAFGYEGSRPAEVDTGSGIIRLKGKIDRVDRDSEGNYHVWDYKTGSAYLFDADGYIAGGRQLQHILYAMVLEKVMGCSVSICGYLLPTERGRSSGKGLVFERDPGEKERWQNGLNLVLDLVSSGLFIVSDEENPPYIDDTDIYGDDLDKKYLKEKIKDPRNQILSKWRQLKDYR